MLRIAVVALVLAVGGVAHAERVVALAPLSTLGAEDTSASTKKVIGDIEAAIAAQPGTKLVKTAEVLAAIKKANKPALKACEGDVSCLTELGKLVGANVLVSGEVGGLGASTVVYLSATNMASGKEERSTTLAVGKDNAATGAVVQLLDPDKYRGTVKFAIDVSGARVQVNGDYRPLAADGTLVLPVGTHAVRVTHPQYHDFAKFVVVEYGKTTEVPVGMQAYPVITHDVQGGPTNLDKIIRDKPVPVYRRWYVTGPAIVVLAVAAGIIVGTVTHDFPTTDDCRRVGGGTCPR